MRLREGAALFRIWQNRRYFPSGGESLEKQEILHQIGAATYVIERVFTQNKPPREAVIEEIITTAKQAMKFDHSDGKMV